MPASASREPASGGEPASARPASGGRRVAEVLAAGEFVQRLDAEVRQARARGEPLSLVRLAVEPAPGAREAGAGTVDRSLAEAARRLRVGVRRTEPLGALGAGQFAWVLPGTDDLSAWHAAERLAALIPGEATEALPLTVTAGVCELSYAESTLELLRLAELALRWAGIQGGGLTFRYAPEVVDLLSKELREGPPKD
jgi:GGDEF domain-containing protein